jgi:NDP-sugar pyrophosphorylase family protein
MKAMVLAAGKGTRLFPLTGEIPKPLAPVADTPIISHIFELLASQGIEKSYVNVNYLADNLLSVFGENTSRDGMNVHLSREERLMGTAGGVKRLEAHFDETFVVISGDALTDVDIDALVSFHKEKGALATIALKRVFDTSEFGVVEIDEDGNIKGFQEKPDPREAISTLANTGIYVFEPEIFTYVPADTFYDFAGNVFPQLLENGERFVGCEGNFYWSDIGTLETYREAQYDVLSGRVSVRIPGERRGESLWVRENAHVHPTASLDGYIVIGEDAVLGRGVSLHGDVTVGSDCWVRPGATIKRSILLPGASVGENTYLEGCIVGHGYDVRPGDTIRGGALIRPGR